MSEASEQIAGQLADIYPDYNKLKTLVDVGFFLENYVVEGGVVTKDVTYNNQIDVTEIVVSLDNDVTRRAAASFQTTTANTTYYLDYQSGDFKFSTAHPTGSYQPVAEVTTDANKNVLTITDKRGTVGGFRLSPGYTYPEIAAIQTEITRQTKASSSIDINPALLNMHFGVLRGVGWMQENANYNQYAVTQASTKGSKILYCANASTIFTDGQLICYTDINGEYYSNVVASASSTQINLVFKLEAAVDTTSEVMHFYINSSHPNTWGYNTIADYAIRELNRVTGDLIYRFLPDVYTAIDANTNVFAPSRIQNYLIPYGFFDAASIHIAALNSGVQKKFKVQKAGVHKITVNINSITDNNIKLSVTTISGTELYAKTLANTNYNSTEEIYVDLDAGSFYIKITCLSASGDAYIGVTEIYRCNKKYDYSMLNKGTHVLLGDSWFEVEGIYERFVSRFPNANIINFGIGGNQLQNITRRFTGTTITGDGKPAFPERDDATTIPKIDYVWVVCGTNDYFGNKTAADYQAQMKTLVSHITQRNAKPLIFSASVGDKFDTLVTGNPLFDLSQQYADFYFNLNTDVSACRVYNAVNTSVATGVFTALTFDSERYDTENIHSITINQSRLTCKTPGLYRITGNIAYASAAAGIRYAVIRLNGGTFIGVALIAPTGSFTVVNVTTTYELDAGDYVELVAYQDTGSFLDVVFTDGYSPEFMMERI